MPALGRAPSTYMGAGYSLGTNQAIFNTASHGTPTSAQLTNAAADATTGDIAQIIMAILDKAYGVYIAADSADRPVKFTMSRFRSENSEGQEQRTYQIVFVMDEDVAQSVDPE